MSDGAGSFMEELVSGHSLLVFAGEGGVGKTSLAASAALAAARGGRRVAVITIDPAPRLANALGLDKLGGLAREVPLGGNIAPGGLLVAMKLDTQATLDRMVGRLTPASAAAVLANPIYKALAGAVSGSDAYVAMQRLSELDKDEDWDLLIVDTPPAAHLADLLSAPARLTALLDSGVTRVLAEPALLLARTASRLAHATLWAVLQVIERVSGLAFRSQVTEFIDGFGTVLTALEEGAGEVELMLRRAGSAFVVVTRPDRRAAKMAGQLSAELASEGLAIGALVVNRVTPDAPPHCRGVAVALAGAPPGTTETLALMEAEMLRLRASESAVLVELDDLARSLEPEPAYGLIAELPVDVCGPEQLELLWARPQRPAA
ncbi:MAG: ArsA-related P-loop ATPase [Deltaproteobacteria bacterium]